MLRRKNNGSKGQIIRGIVPNTSGEMIPSQLTLREDREGEGTERESREEGPG